MALLLEDNDFFVKDPDFFCQRLEALSELRGKAVEGEWIEKVRSGQTPEVVLDLLMQHYDPLYTASIRRNFSQYGKALPCVLVDQGKAALLHAARSLLHPI